MKHMKKQTNNLPTTAAVIHRVMRNNPSLINRLESDSKVIRRTRWTPEAVKKLRAMVAEGQRPREIANVFECSLSAIQHKMQKLGLRVRKLRVSRSSNADAVVRPRRGCPRKTTELTRKAFHRLLPTPIDIYTRARELSLENILARRSVCAADEWREAEMETVAAFFGRYRPGKKSAGIQ
jgi:hypothetical protein